MEDTNKYKRRIIILLLLFASSLITFFFVRHYTLLNLCIEYFFKLHLIIFENAQKGLT